MNSTPNAVSKDLKTVTEACDTEVKEGSRPCDTFAGSAAAEYGSPLPVPEDAVDTFLGVFVFTDDILPKILDNIGILEGKDLLNFRLVNRCWRDAATLVILKRNVCQIALNFGEVEVTLQENTSSAVAQAELNRANDFSDKPPSYKYFNVYHPKSYLSDLSTLISTSVKFPSSSICFHKGCNLGLRNVHPVSDFNTENQNQKDLFHFLSLYGKNIRKLSFCSEISKKAVQNLLYVHMPHLSCLDLQYFFKFSIQDQTQENIKIHVCPSILEIREIVLGHEPELSVDKSKFIKELIRVSPNLSESKNVGVSALKVLLEMEKCHIIKDLHFNPRPHQLPIVRQFTELLTKMNLISDLPRLKLNKLVVQLRCQNPVCLSYLQIILCANKDSLKYLKLHPGNEKAVLQGICNTLPTVRTIQMNEIPLNDRLWSKYFPNVTHLKISCKLSNNLENRNWTWAAFPKIKKFEIFGLKIVGDTTVVDTFFTGMSYDLCAKLQSGSETLTELGSAGPTLVLERTQPYIGDCEHLQEFKIYFESKLNWAFASSVTAVYGFYELFHRTKIIFSFESIKLTAKEIQDTHKYLEPVAAYVEIQMRK